MKIFLSRPLTNHDPKKEKEDNLIVEDFKAFLKEIMPCFDFVQKPPAYDRDGIVIKKTIDGCKGAIGILTKETKVADKEEWRTKGWILTEVAYILGKGLPVPIFVEKEVSDLGFAGDLHYERFSRDNDGKLVLDKKAATEYLATVFNPSGQPYNIKSQECNIYVSRDGEGLVENLSEIYRSPSSIFNQIQVECNLDPTQTDSFPSFSEMSGTKYRYRFEKPILYCRIVGNSDKHITMEEDIQKSTDRKRVYSISFSPNLEELETVKIATGWSHHNLFSYNKGERSDNYTIISDRYRDKLIIKIFFETGYPLEGEPWLDIKDSENNPVKDMKILGHSGFIHAEKAYGVEFSREFHQIQPNIFHDIKWKLD